MTVSGSNTTEATIINLMPSTMFIVQVAAINDAGYGIYSDPLTVSSTELSTATVCTAANSAGTGTNSETMTTETPTGKI